MKGLSGSSEERKKMFIQTVKNKLGVIVEERDFVVWGAGCVIIHEYVDKEYGVLKEIQNERM